MSEFSLLIGKAAVLSTQLHENHMDRDGLPHVFHCMRVAMKQETPQAIIVALLHDAVEDSHKDALRLIQEAFGYDVAMAVTLLTRYEGESYANYISRIIASGNFDAMLIKKADIEDNTRVGRVDAKAAKNFPMYKEAHLRLCEALGIQSNLSLASQE